MEQPITRRIVECGEAGFRPLPRQVAVGGGMMRILGEHVNRKTPFHMGLSPDSTADSFLNELEG
jgi:hypothetical protein